jgi:hypothetical protein
MRGEGDLLQDRIVAKVAELPGLHLGRSSLAVAEAGFHFIS